MMWSTIANLKENLNKIALDVHHDDEEVLAIYNFPDRPDSTLSPHRISHNFPHSKSLSNSPVANGFDSPSNPEIEQYKAEIKRLLKSEAEIKALSVNYAALLKEKEDQISRLNEQNGSLKQNLDATSTALNASRNESFKTSTNSPNSLEGGDQSPNRQHKALVKNRSVGNPAHNGIVSKQDVLNNGIAHSMQPDVLQSKMESRHSSTRGNEKELADLLEEKSRSLATMQATHELQMKQLGVELERERGKFANMQVRLQEEQKLNRSFQEELNAFKSDKDKMFAEMNKVHDELNKKTSEIRQLQMELSRRDNAEASDIVENLKGVIATLEKENCNLKKVQSSGGFPGKEEMELSLQKLEKDLKEACQERDKAIQGLNRLKQHLLDKESEESEKMDEDSKIIEELRGNNEYQRAQILHLEKALKQAIANQEGVKMFNNNELQKYKEIIDDLNKKLASCMSTIDAKNVELLNLQTALGQYYAEIEAKEHLEEDLALAREESARHSELLKDAYQQAEISKRETEETLVKLSQAERMIAEGKNRVNKLEEDNAKLRRALEQSMTRLNRMSMDSDYFVDRRIVIKLLVTYFQRNHSKEVLDLMVRMLGFSDEDKQRIGFAQQVAGKGVVRGVLGLPGRLVGGILGGSLANAPGNVTAENQSFADLWVDFLLKETEKRERIESAEAINGSKGDQHGGSPSATGAASPMADRMTAASFAPGSSRLNPPVNQNQFPQSSHGNFLPTEHSDSEFSTVPLTSSDNNSQFSRLLPRS